MIRFLRNSHLDDDQIVSGYFADRFGEAWATGVREHLASCDACMERYRAWEDLFATARADADHAHDELCTPDHLRQQAAQIIRRLDPSAGPARIISFPVHTTLRSAAPAGRGARWRLVAAGIAGLAIGLAGGGSFLLGDRRPGDASVRPADAMRVSPSSQEPPTMLRIAATPTASESTTDDDTFLQELEYALDHSAAELLPFDVLTPVNEEMDALSR